MPVKENWCLKEKHLDFAKHHEHLTGNLQWGLNAANADTDIRLHFVLMTSIWIFDVSVKSFFSFFMF